MNATSASELLDYAISEEEKAAKFYSDMSTKATRPGMKEAFGEFVNEEQSHKEKLIKIKNGGNFMGSLKPVLDLDISNYLVDVVPSPDVDYQHLLVIALKKEKAAFKMYTQLAAKTSDPEVRNMLNSLANDEAKHKLKIEIEYDDFVLKEN